MLSEAVIQNFSETLSHNVERLFDTMSFILSGTPNSDPVELNIKYREYISNVNSKIHEIYTRMNDHKIQ